jgi:hypothetical protein
MQNVYRLQAAILSAGWWTIVLMAFSILVVAQRPRLRGYHSTSQRFAKVFQDG